MLKRYKEKLFALIFIFMYLAISTADYNDQKMMEDYKSELRK